MGKLPARTLAACTLAFAGATTVQGACAQTAPDAGATAVFKQSVAEDPKSYRRDAARHIYDRFGPRIYKGRMPPLLHAVGVLQIDVDGDGKVDQIRWMRAPNHVPEVMAEIERMVRDAAPFPVPARMGRVTYTDVWLWHKSGRFQLDTLTEGQD